MAAARKPSSKKPAKRGPTKAAALKALGLTQEDLDNIKLFKSTVENVRNEQETAGPNVVTGEAVVHPGPGLGGEDPQAALEGRLSPPRREWNAPDEDSAPVWYARNLRGVDVGFRLTRQQKQGEKRTNLKPRGARGDMIRLEPSDLKDPELQTQVGYQLVEVIPEGEALEAIKKQYTNQQTQVPEHIRSLRNAKGEEYAQSDPVKFATDEEAYGIKVADLDPALMQGKLSDQEIRRDAGIMQPVQNPSPGNIIEDGFIAPTVTEDRGNNEKQSEVDAKFRARQFEDRPEDNLGVKVTVEETRRVQ